MSNFERSRDADILGAVGADVGELQVRSSDRCNNHCLFCTDRSPLGRRHLPPDAVEQVEALLRAHAGTPSVMFTSSEPTLNPALVGYVRLARSLRYRRIGVTTNGRRLSYEPYARSLVETGMNRVVLSLHGADAQLHDSLTRAPGSFAQTLAGLRNVAALRGEFRVSIHTSTVVTTRNLHRLGEVVDLVAPLRPDSIVFNIVHPLGGAAAEGASLVPRYGDAVAAFQSLLRRPGASLLPLLLVDAPLCATEGMPEAFRGTYTSTLYGKPSATREAVVQHTADRKERAHRMKREPCARCRYDARCLGVWENYVRAFGWDGLEPVS